MSAVRSLTGMTLTTKLAAAWLGTFLFAATLRAEPVLLFDVAALLGSRDEAGLVLPDGARFDPEAPRAALHRLATGADEVVAWHPRTRQLVRLSDLAQDDRNAYRCAAPGSERYDATREAGFLPLDPAIDPVAWVRQGTARMVWMPARADAGACARPEPRLALSTDRLDLGRVPPGAVATGSLILGNSGRGELRIRSAAIVGQHFEVQQDGCSGRALEGGEACILGLGFVADEAGDYDARVDIVHHAAATATPVALSATAGFDPGIFASGFER
jgi:hypothetical protein